MSISGKDAGDLAYAKTLDVTALGFRCGLEIHQQLDTRKLFSPCPSEVVDPDAVRERTLAVYDRRLRATQSELGELDVAVLAEARRRKAFRYLAIEGLTSLVELDEEPPHRICDEALDVALTFAGLAGARPADEVHVMRKTVIDGSNTSGFQRTALVATGGTIDVQDDAPEVGVWTIAVEEDSARKIDEDQDGVIRYSLDRLGIPLIEIATAPDIQSPQHAQQTAARIGALLRATGRVKRGLGTIRQDLNVSIAVGDRIEIKGCQDLRAVPRVIEHEVRRQLWLYHVAEALRERGFTANDIPEPLDVTDTIQEADSKIIQGALKRGGKVLAQPLPKWAGLIAGRSKEGPRMGREFADHAKVAAGVRGVFHSDELPAYGINEDQVTAMRKLMKLGDNDGFVLCVERETTARRALEAVAERAASALQGTSREVRAAQPDDSTRYMRPLPGAARMYPETDVPPTRITHNDWQRILDNLPARPEERVATYVEEHGLSAEQAGQIVREGRGDDLENLLAAGVDAPLAARILLQYLTDLKEPERILGLVPAMHGALQSGAFAKEAVPDILKALDEEPTLDVAGAIEAAGAGAVNEEEVDAVIQRIIQERIDFVRERGMASMGPLMGPVMGELRGKADGATISDRLKQAIQAALQSNS